MTYGLPAHGEPSWDTKLVASVDAVKTTADTATTDLAAHKANVANPHAVTKSQVGLGNVDNTSDVNKPVSTAQQAALDAKVSRTTRTAHAPALGLYFPEADGAVGNGSTNDATALGTTLTTAATAKGQVCLAPGVTYAINSQLTIPANTRILGNGATIKLAASAARIATLNSNTRIEDVTFDGNNNATSYLTELVASADTVTLLRCRYTSTGGTGPIGIRTNDSTVNLLVDTCTFDNLNNCIKLDKNPNRVRIRNSYFTQWEDRAIWAVSSAGFAAQNVWIENNRILPHRVRLSLGVPDMAQVRQPIAIQGVDTDLHQNIHITGNHVLGAGYSYNNTTNPGSADLISVHRTSGLKVSQNIVEYGGDVGITVAQQCDNITVIGNIARFNDSAGICIGSSSSTSTSDGTVVGNTCMNNGQNRAPAGGTTWNLNGINMNICQRINVTGNRCGDTQGTKTQQYGITAQATTDCIITENLVAGNNVSGYHTQGTGNVRLAYNFPPVRSTLSADQTVNNSTTLVDSGLVVDVAPEAIYEVRGFLIYNSSTTADMNILFVGPAGATMNWSGDSPHSAATSGNPLIHRTANTIGTTLTVGGFAANAIGQPLGVLTVGATAGTLKLQFAQAVAEVSNTILRAGSWLQLERIG